MATIKKRINISLPNDVERALAKLARREQIPQATKAALLVEKAMELEEDQLWEEIARERDRAGVRFVSHKKAWA